MLTGNEQTVKVSGSTVLTGSVRPGSAWIRGSSYQPGQTGPKSLAGEMITTSRPEVLVNGTGFYHTIVQPTYAEFDLSQVVNVKTVATHPVLGNAVADDTASLQAIINDSVGKVVYFPHGIYLLSDTLIIPPGSRLVGEAFTQLSATGNKFKNPSNPKPMLKIGNPGDVGTAQLHDFVFTVNEILPGVDHVQVNMAGTKPGDVGFFFCVFRVGGAKGSKVWNNCANPLTCNAARISAHLTASSSSYWENIWAWSGDLDLDGGSSVLASPAAGLLIEAQKGTWLLGLGAGEFPLAIHN